MYIISKYLHNIKDDLYNPIITCENNYKYCYHTYYKSNDTTSYIEELCVILDHKQYLNGKIRVLINPLSSINVIDNDITINIRKYGTYYVSNDRGKTWYPNDNFYDKYGYIYHNTYNNIILHEEPIKKYDNIDFLGNLKIQQIMEYKYKRTEIRNNNYIEENGEYPINKTYTGIGCLYNK